MVHSRSALRTKLISYISTFPCRMDQESRRWDRRRFPTALFTQSVQGMKRQWACLLVHLDVNSPPCRCCLRNLRKIKEANSMRVPASVDSCVHCCQAGSSRNITCATYLERPNSMVAGQTPDCWPLSSSPSTSPICSSLAWLRCPRCYAFSRSL